MTKELRDNEVIVRDLLYLRDELAERKGIENSGAYEVLLKINSCLYRGYPLKDLTRD